MTRRREIGRRGQSKGDEVTVLGECIPSRDLALRYRTGRSVTRGRVATWVATVLCTGGWRPRVIGFLEQAPKSDVELRERIEAAVRNNIERRIGID